MAAPNTAATPAAEPLGEKQAAAILASGWGRPFHLVQPRNLGFWVWTVGVLYGAWAAFHQFSPLAPVAGQALGVGALVALGYGALLWLFFRWIDRYDRLPILLVVTAFLWGGLAATYGIAIVGNTSNMNLMGKLIGQGFVNDWGPGISAPLVEETSKAAGFLLLLALAPKVLHSPRAALMAGAFIGLGFQILEDDLYSVNGAAEGFFVDQSASVLHMSVLRMASGLISHPAYTAIFCVGILYIVGSPAVKRNVPRGLLFIVISMLIHGSWDASAAIANSNGGLVLGVMLGSTLLAIFSLRWAFRLSQPLEQGWMRAILAPEVAAGHVTTDEIDAAAGRRKARGAFVKAGHGHGAHANAKHVLEATIDLAHEIAAADGAETPAVAHARAELDRLRGAAPRTGAAAS